MIFSYQQYSDFLQYLKSKGKVTTLRDWDGEKSFILRHDVDLDVELAFELSKIESENGIVSSYFFLTSGNTYNVIGKKNADMLKQMSKMGHEIGLHFDPTIYSEGEMNEAVKKEAEILSFVSGSKIESISLHNPSIHGTYPMFEGYKNAYDPKIFSNENYISDSRMQFRGKDIYGFLDGIKNSHLQILLHPMHFSEKGYGYEDIFKKYIYNTLTELNEFFSTNTTYQKKAQGNLFELIKGNNEQKN
ncbi:hypothetical protein BH10BAC5_BH10BAC5_11310 [soil metagenome]